MRRARCNHAAAWMAAFPISMQARGREKLVLRIKSLPQRQCWKN
jgi:hypothetical protein